MILGSIALGDRDGKSDTDPDTEAHHQELDAARSAHGGKLIRSEIAADDRRVHHIVGLLQQISQKQWKGETQDQFQRISGCHSLCHGKESFLNVS